MCLFMDDGRFLSASKDSLRLFSPAKEILWEMKGHFHHQLNFSIDKKRILALSSEVVKRGKTSQRDDVFLIVDLAGNVLHRESFYPHMMNHNLAPLLWSRGGPLKDVGADNETSHINSIYEIPANAYDQSVPWLKAGNIIVNSTGLGVFIFTPDLKNILHQKRFDFSLNHMVHDVQITPDGDYFFFNNWVKTPQKSPISAVQKFNEPQNKMTFDFQASPPEMFYSAVCGGVQEIDDIIFFSHNVNGAYFYSKKKKTILFAVPGYNGNPSDMRPLQQLKLINVNDFLKSSGN